MPVLNPMTYEECVQWIENLRSGNYIQGKNRLKRIGISANRYCCLGVVAALIMDGFYVGIPGSTQRILMRMNDEGQTFREIANWIEENFLPQCMLADALRSIGWGV